MTAAKHEVGALVSLSSLREGDCGVTDACRQFIVVRRVPEDRASGTTEVEFRDGVRHDFVWSRSDPRVRYLGRGARVTMTSIAWPDGEDTYRVTEDTR